MPNLQDLLKKVDAILESTVDVSSTPVSRLPTARSAPGQHSIPTSATPFFRKGQREIVETILNGKNVFAVFPTGHGKSLCYQLPALILDGITVVISPLISLMKDQVDTLREQGIDAVSLNQ